MNLQGDAQGTWLAVGKAIVCRHRHHHTAKKKAQELMWFNLTKEVIVHQLLEGRDSIVVVITIITITRCFSFHQKKDSTPIGSECLKQLQSHLTYTAWSIHYLVPEMRDVHVHRILSRLGEEMSVRSVTPCPPLSLGGNGRLGAARPTDPCGSCAILS